MAEPKTATKRGAGGVLATRVEPKSRAQHEQPIRGGIQADRETQLDPVEALILDFSAPSPQTASWLGDPRLAATLQAIRDELAPGGVSKDPSNRYAASVIETHLVAHRRLTKLTNALLKT